MLHDNVLRARATKTLGEVLPQPSQFALKRALLFAGPLGGSLRTDERLFGRVQLSGNGRFFFLQAALRGLHRRLLATRLLRTRLRILSRCHRRQGRQP